MSLRAMRTVAFVLAAVLTVAGCDIFQTREPQEPNAGTSTFEPPVTPDAVLRNLNETGSGLLVSKALVDLARNADGTFKSTKTDDLTFTLFTGKNGDPAKPIAWPGFDFYLTGQWGAIASPAWLDAVKADPTKATAPIGSGPFIVQSFVPHDQLVVTKNPKYWAKDADGNWLIDGTPIAVQNIQASNGVIHAMGAVLIPPSVG